jgi:ferritin-like metal-binding protein YciE
MVEEATEVMSDYKDSPALDAGLLAAAQSVEHYEISRYGTLKQLGHGKAVNLLDQTLQEQRATDEALSALAETALNQLPRQHELNLRLGFPLLSRSPGPTIII